MTAGVHRWTRSTVGTGPDLRERGLGAHALPHPRPGHICWGWAGSPPCGAGTGSRVLKCQRQSTGRGLTWTCVLSLDALGCFPLQRGEMQGQGCPDPRPRPSFRLHLGWHTVREQDAPVLSFGSRSSDNYCRASSVAISGPAGGRKSFHSPGCPLFGPESLLKKVLPIRLKVFWEEGQMDRGREGRRDADKKRAAHFLFGSFVL